MEPFVKVNGYGWTRSPDNTKAVKSFSWSLGSGEWVWRGAGLDLLQDGVWTRAHLQRIRSYNMNPWGTEINAFGLRWCGDEHVLFRMQQDVGGTAPYSFATEHMLRTADLSIVDLGGTTPRWAPDGTALAVGGEVGRVVVRPWTGDAPTGAGSTAYLINSFDDAPRARWSADGSRLAFLDFPESGPGWATSLFTWDGTSLGPRTQVAGAPVGWVLPDVLQVRQTCGLLTLTVDGQAVTELGGTDLTPWWDDACLP